ncbi:MAG: hypothetical protein K0M70_07965 [Arenimonas sp.]|uniref:hypothetical protein n=1 Tax=Arenimonas sp. TaxID=1872635 RepID=UPI0025C4831C|nr:hypothetical protein [Arenimonas sp.]MBW8367777.1 hypothetical protein [Arenimonas sp.]
MPIRALLACVLLLAAACAHHVSTPPVAESDAALEARIARLLKAQPLVDGHNDLIISYLY